MRNTNRKIDRTHLRKPLADRFWAKVNKTNGCWEWTGTDSGSGYGQVWFDGKLHAAHRVSWEMHFGEITNGLFVLHKCDNRICVNPAHLFLGDKKDNAIDASRKGRLGNQKLDIGKVIDIRNSQANGEPATITAERLGICAAHVRKVARRKAWEHV